MEKQMEGKRRREGSQVALPHQGWLHPGGWGGRAARPAQPRTGRGGGVLTAGCPRPSRPDQAHTAQLHAHKHQGPRHQPAAETQHTALRSHAAH